MWDSVRACSKAYGCRKGTDSKISNMKLGESQKEQKTSVCGEERWLNISTWWEMDKKAQIPLAASSNPTMPHHFDQAVLNVLLWPVACSWKSTIFNWPGCPNESQVESLEHNSFFSHWWSTDACTFLVLLTRIESLFFCQVLFQYFNIICVML